MDINEQINEIKSKMARPSVPQRIARLIFILFSVMMVAVYISYLMGSRYFLLPNYPDARILTDLGKVILFCLNMALYIIFTTKTFDRKVAIALIPIGLIHIALCSTVGNTLFVTAFMPLMYCLCFSIVHKKSLQLTIVRFLIVSIITIAYQCVAMPIKLQLFPNPFNTNYSLVTTAFLQVDFMLFLINLCLLEVSSNVWKCLVFREDVTIAQLDHEDLVAIERFKSLNGFKRAKAVTVLFAFQIAQLFLILAICKIGDVLIECIVILASFWLSGSIIKWRWHSNNLIVCTLASMAIFYAASRITIPFQYSMFMPIVVGVIVTYSLCRVAIVVDEYKTLKSPKPFKCEEATIESFRDRCRECGFPLEKTVFAIDILSCDRIEPLQAVADKHFRSISYVKALKSKIRKRLESI